MSLFSLALKSNLPLIAVQTDDPVNFVPILQAYSGKIPKIPFYVVTPSKQAKLEGTFTEGELYYIEYLQNVDWKRTYSLLNERGATLVVLNPERKHPEMFDVGFVGVPQSVIESFVGKRVLHKKMVPAIVAALAGLTYKQMIEVSAMAMTEYGQFNAWAIRNIRRHYFPLSAGLDMVDTEQVYYRPSEELKSWLNLEGQLFNLANAKLMIPRGLLFTGAPGTGKTSGAKYLAQELDLPLYRLDMAGIMNKYVGESEKNIREALLQTEALQPCLVLIDEVEKLFNVHDDTGVTARVLSWLLWWLQEHSSKVLTIMTTNAEDKIPPELYRPGRIDRTMHFTSLKNEEVVGFAKDLLNKLKGLAQVSEEELLLAVAGYNVQAKVTEAVLSLVRCKHLVQLKSQSQ